MNRMIEESRVPENHASFTLFQLVLVGSDLSIPTWPCLKPRYSHDPITPPIPLRVGEDGSRCMCEQ